MNISKTIDECSMTSNPTKYLDKLLCDDSILTKTQAFELLQIIGVKSFLVDKLLQTEKTLSWASLCGDLLDELFENKDWVSDNFNGGLLNDENWSFIKFLSENTANFHSLGFGILRHSLKLPKWMIRVALSLPPPTPEEMYVSVCTKASDNCMVALDSFYFCK